MKVYYAIFYPLLHFLFAGLLMTLLSVAYAVVEREPFWFELLFIVVLIIRGILFIRLPYFELKKNELIIFNRLGGSFKTYKFNSIKDFHLEENKLFVLQNDRSKKVKISRVFVSQSKWMEFQSLIRQENLESELH